MRTKMRLARISKGLTAKQAAHLIGVHENAILRWESGEAEPLGSNLMKMAKLYDVSPYELLEESPEHVNA